MTLIFIRSGYFLLLYDIYFYWVSFNCLILRCLCFFFLNREEINKNLYTFDDSKQINSAPLTHVQKD